MKQYLSAKIHGLRVTDKDVRYTGSVTIDADLMRAAGIESYEKVQVVNLSNGRRWETYALEGEPGRGEFTLNGGSARVGEMGDTCIVMTYVLGEAASPRLVYVDEKNRLSEVVPSRMN